MAGAATAAMKRRDAERTMKDGVDHIGLHNGMVLMNSGLVAKDPRKLAEQIVRKQLEMERVDPACAS
eukprot:CAMPEP_0173384140 /NCGR_PEP_ID=MMETSP1356-20130122/6708_1 /TAXON_ID=77927 ORGANISM="Hemiselmis virescens, Strain PCC157" /NCGR_SAMPLE_ID=MMETSP1356 /ASSEMBLY_ACC=CAM_ASM_000847 /LENGTH=66 /DNA_ID=CAMNT_0014339339 /DNA_START=177 /DNA_END=377 /DNA_ORIENTATION=+